MTASHSTDACGVQLVALGVGLLDGLMLMAGYGLAQWLVIEHLHPACYINYSHLIDSHTSSGALHMGHLPQSRPDQSPAQDRRLLRIRIYGTDACLHLPNRLGYKCICWSITSLEAVVHSPGAESYIFTYLLAGSMIFQSGGKLISG